MKYFSFLLFFVAFTAVSQNCTTAVSNNLFQQHYSHIANQNNDQHKLDHAVAFTGTNCLTSNQVKLIAMLFQSEQSRLDFCKLSYRNTVDKDNFYDVYDAFQKFSFAFKLHDYVTAHINGEITVPVVLTTQNSSISFPNYQYPSYNGYTGPTGCDGPISNKDFMVLATQMNSYKSDDEKVVAGTLLMKDHCMSMAQAMKLASLIQLETKGMKLMQGSFQYMYDRGNYNSATQLFSTKQYQLEWIQFCNDFLAPAEPIVTCGVSEDDFKGMLKRIDNANFANDQLELLKAINNTHCFTTAQVKRFMDTFSFPENKLDVAELLYPKCSDYENYYTLKGEFSFPSYEEQFQTMLNGG